MNIVQTSITYPPAIGGLDRYVKETSEGLVRRGHRVTVITTDLEQPLGRQRLTIPSTHTDQAEVHRLSTWRIPRVGFPILIGMKPIIARVSPDVIHAHCALHSSALLAWHEARRRRIPFVLNTIMSPRSGLFWSLYYKNQAQRMMGDANCVIAISEFERDILIRHGLSRSRITVLPPAVDLEPFKMRYPSVFPRYGLEKNRVIVSLGRLAYGKRIDRLILAMPAVLRKHPDARLMIIGPDYGDEARLKQIIESQKLTGEVELAGALSTAEVASALQSSAIFAMTTDFELFGITLIEAMAAGTAVVAPDVASVPYVVRNEETGLLYPYDNVDQLSGKIDRILSDDALRARLVAAGLHETKTRFDFGRNLDALEEIYRNVRRS